MSASAAQPIVSGVVALLTNATAVSAIVGSRIYDTMTPQNPATPFVVVSIASDAVQGYFNGTDDLGPMEVQVDSYGTVEASIKTDRALSDAVYAAMHRQTFTASGYHGISILCTNRGLNTDQDLIVAGRTQQDAWRIMQAYSIYGTGS